MMGEPQIGRLVYFNDRARELITHLDWSRVSRTRTFRIVSARNIVIQPRPGASPWLVLLEPPVGFSEFNACYVDYAAPPQVEYL